ncbi:MAG TPA: mismatch repair protein [Terriglobales bacterium]|nr:mismatch repair protein [Terriglobales bacterium]
MSAVEEYPQRLKARESRVADYEKVHLRLGNLRLALVATAALLLWLAYRRYLPTFWWLAVPAVAFLAVAVYHSRILRAQSLAQRAVDFYRRGMARIEDRWTGTGQTGERFDDPHHVYASDLDLFGKGSLFELLSVARTRMGEETLANWLLAPAPVKQIHERRGAIVELRDLLDFREELSVLGEDAKVGVHPEALLRWAEAPNRQHRRWLQWVAPLCAVLFMASVAFWWYSGWITPLLVVVISEALLTYRLRSSLDDILHGTEDSLGDLELLAAVLARIERQSLQSPRLQTLKNQLSSHHLPSSVTINRLRTIVEFIRAGENIVMRTLDTPLMYSVQVAFAAERWRSVHGKVVRQWLGAIGELEGLLSLATYSFEHPDDPFPEFAEGNSCIEGMGLAHPLLAAAKCVGNDVSLCGETRVLLVSGSNMSGKSTLLRVIGTNVVLAMAGAPVRARSLRINPLYVGASIRVNDSLQEGSSRFYAEITRLRDIYNLSASEPSMLFLLDEFLQGTNSHDRLIGAEGVIGALLNRGAIGVVTTHDLALTAIRGLPDGALRNMHFQDEFEDGQMNFDYALKEGIVTKSNGLALMRSIGLDV